MKAKISAGTWFVRAGRSALCALAVLTIGGRSIGGVVTNCTETALRAAMAGGGTVTFACDGTITLANTVTNDVDLIMDGSSHQVTISGQNAVRVFLVNSNVTLNLISLTIANGASPGGSAIWNRGGTVNLTGVTFSGNTAGFFTNDVHGGAIWNQAGQVNLRSCSFVGNHASGGTHIVNYFVQVGNSGWGGAIYNSGTTTLELCTLTGNSATGGNGGPGHDSWGGGGGGGYGGAIFNDYGATLNADRTTFTSNTVGGGSAGTGAQGNPSSRGVGFQGGYGGGAYGGAIYATYGSGLLWVSCSTFAENVATGGGGGNGGDGGTPYGLGGDAGPGGCGCGGALWYGGAVSVACGLVNCTFASNTGRGGAGGTGGTSTGPYGWPGGRGGDGGYALGGVDGTCNLTNCTVAANSGYAGSGGLGGFNQGPPGTSGTAWGGTACGPMTNTLIAFNSPAGGDTFPDPKLGPLTNNGGPTLTMALLPGSPAIDAGNAALAPATDQRGFPRPAGLAADIGAFEYGSVMPTLSISRSGASGLNILATGNTGRWCRLLSSTDLTSWVPVGTNQFGGGGTTLFCDTCSPGPACRFYRLVMP